uniref:SFRICE_018148 n=1 Tax=Spodoptera frugiperda TaxID=7108 RepID=A0A2H1WHW8_SPOFR
MWLCEYNKMEEIPHHPLITVTPESVKKVRQMCEIDDVQKIKDCLDIIEEWISKQDHLVEASKYITRNLLERVFLIAKGSTEGTKRRIERLLTSRGMMPELCMNRTVEEFETQWDVVHYVPLPKLHPVDQSRVMVTQFLTEKLDPFSILSYFRYCFLIGEYRINYDYTPSERFVIDLTNIHFGLLGKLNPITIKKSEVLCTEGIGTKIKGIHILNAPPFIDKLVFILKQALREKVANRVHVHNSYEDLQKHIPREILPKDYGGDDQSVAKLSERWKETLRTPEARQLIKDAEKLVSDESKRQTSKFNEEYMGMPGSFRKLTVD